MFKIICNDKIILICNNPQYVLYDENTKDITLVDDCNEGNGIIIGDQLYSIPQYCETEVYKGAPSVEIHYINTGADILNNAYSKSNQNEKDVVDIEDAILDLDGTNQEDLDDIRQAIFDLAARLENLSSAKE